MTNLEVEIISRETVKPSSPTPSHLRSFRLSLLDQICPLVYPPLVFFYTKTETLVQTEDPSAQLKSSLSQALTCFYPLAGRIKDNLSLDCNDDGALFLMAKVTSSLTEFLQNPPQLDVLERFLPLPMICTVPAEVAVQIAVQINLFSCGGIAVGLCGLHRIIDATTISAFLKCWSAIAREKFIDKAAERVDCVAAALLFPPRESETAIALGQEGIRISTRRFVFDAEAISKLKTKSVSESVTNPTSVEALSGFVWKYLMNASKKASGGFEKPSVLSSAVNLRRLLEPPLPEHKVGNIAWRACCRCEATDEERQLQDLVALIRNSFAEINREFVQKLVGKDGMGVISKLWEEFAELCTDGNPNSYMFTSVRNMGFSEVDFGWGKPTWVSFKERKECSNIVTFIETRGGDGIEAWVTLAEHELFILENDPEFLAFASLNPAIECSRAIYKPLIFGNSKL